MQVGYSIGLITFGLKNLDERSSILEILCLSKELED